MPSRQVLAQQLSLSSEGKSPNFALSHVHHWKLSPTTSFCLQTVLSHHFCFSLPLRENVTREHSLLSLSLMEGLTEVIEIFLLRNLCASLFSIVVFCSAERASETQILWSFLYQFLEKLSSSMYNVCRTLHFLLVGTFNLTCKSEVKRILTFPNL